jgi:SulP family sulfate permease
MGLCSAVVCGIPLFFGSSFLTWIPKPVLGSLLIFVGLSFMIKWVYDAWFSLPPVDYVLILVILGIVGTFGFLQGVGAGTLIAVILFVVKYSRISVVKHILSGAAYHSTVERAASYQRLLQEHGEQITIFRLQGFLFFGTANTLLTQVRARIGGPESMPLRYLVLDFRAVNGIDSSALNSFARMRQLAEMHHFSLIFTHLSPEIRRQFQVGGHFEENETQVQAFPDLDHGLEWCEEQILQAENSRPTEETPQLGETFLEIVFDDVMESLKRQEQLETIIAGVMTYLERQDVEKGEYLIRQGDQPEYLYFIETGEVTVWLERENGTRVRLRAMSRGTIVGEIGVYLGYRASAPVVTTQPTTVYRLSIQSLQRMQAADPKLAAVFNEFIACLLGKRLVHANTLLQAFQQ